MRNDPDRPLKQKFYNSTTWRECREAYAKSVGYLCERCKAKGITTAGTEVHHKVKLTAQNINDPNITLNWDNLELLCMTCHNQEHFKKEPVRRCYIDMETGKVIPKPDADELI